MSHLQACSRALPVLFLDLDDVLCLNDSYGGFAAIAYPAKYLQTGVMTFIVNYEGVVYQKDLGPNTAELARKITRYDPGDGWVATSGK